MKIIWWNGPQDITATKYEGSKPTAEMQKSKSCNRYPFFDQGFKSVIDIMDIHNSMDGYNSVVHNHESVIYIHYGHTNLHYGEIVMDIHDLIMDVYNWITPIHNCRELYIRNWIVDVRNCIMDMHNWIMDIHNYTQLQLHMVIHN